MPMSRPHLMLPLLLLLAGWVPSNALALPTLNCTPGYHGTAGNDSMSVNMGSLAADSTTVVCPKGGNDTVIIYQSNSIAANVRVFIAKGNGDLSLSWNSNSIILASDFNQTAPYGNLYLIRPPLANRGTYSVFGNTGTGSSATVRLLCATNTWYKAATDATAFWTNLVANGGGYREFDSAGTADSGCLSN